MQIINRFGQKAKTIKIKKAYKFSGIKYVAQHRIKIMRYDVKLMNIDFILLGALFLIPDRWQKFTVLNNKKS